MSTCKGIDGLIAVCKQKLSVDPFNGSLFLFYNKSKTSIKILSFDGQGFWLCAKRLSKGNFKAKSIPLVEVIVIRQCLRLGLFMSQHFPTRKSFLKYLEVIAWETEVWITDAPTHMIHFNGTRFFGTIRLIQQSKD